MASQTTKTLVEKGMLVFGFLWFFFVNSSLILEEDPDDVKKTPKPGLMTFRSKITYDLAHIKKVKKWLSNVAQRASCPEHVYGRVKHKIVLPVFFTVQKK